RHGTAEIQEEFVRCQEMQRPSHRPCLDDGPFPHEGSLDIVEGQLAKAGPESNPRHCGHLGLDSADISDDAREPAAGGTEVEMVTVHAESGNPSLTDCELVDSIGHVRPDARNHIHGLRVCGALRFVAVDRPTDSFYRAEAHPLCPSPSLPLVNLPVS